MISGLTRTIKIKLGCLCENYCFLGRVNFRSTPLTTLYRGPFDNLNWYFFFFIAVQSQKVSRPM